MPELPRLLEGPPLLSVVAREVHVDGYAPASHGPTSFRSRHLPTRDFCRPEALQTMITQQRIFGTDSTQGSSLGVYNNVGKSKFTPTQPSKQPARSGPRSPRERKFSAARADVGARNQSSGLGTVVATSPKNIFADADINLHNSTTGIPRVAKEQKDILHSPNSVRNIGNVNNTATNDKAKSIQKNIAAAVSLAGERRMPQDLEAKKKKTKIHILFIWTSFQSKLHVAVCSMAMA